MPNLNERTTPTLSDGEWATVLLRLTILNQIMTAVPPADQPHLHKFGLEMADELRKLRNVQPDQFFSCMVATAGAFTRRIEVAAGLGKLFRPIIQAVFVDMPQYQQALEKVMESCKPPAPFRPPRPV